MNLIQKYNVPGPRYTSYPTVPYWEANPTETSWVQSLQAAIQDAARQQLGAALYIHIPFCERLCTYCGCNTRITRNHGVGSPYVDTVLKEWTLYGRALGFDVDSRLPLSEIHLGGGTPTFLETGELVRLIEGILKTAQVKEGAEFSLEADPRVTSREQLAALYQLGFRRLSLGIQDFDPKVQEIVHRVQSVEQVKRVVEDAREIGYTSINFDLIYGLPLQTQTSVEQTLDRVAELRPDRIAFYAYAHVPWIKPGQRRFTEADLPQGDSKRALYELGLTRLKQAGYLEVGMDHFALRTDSLWQASLSGGLHRNFMGYISRQVSPLIGLGVSSIGDSWDAFAQNEKVLEQYEKKIAEGVLPIARGHVLNREDQVIRRHILNLMTRFETHWKEQAFQTDHLESVPGRLDEMRRDGLVEILDCQVRITPAGRAFIRNVCMAFDARLIRKQPESQLFSQTV